MQHQERQRIRSGLILMAVAVAAMVAVFRIPLQSIFVLGIALLCPLLMFGMHTAGHGHGPHDGQRHEEAER